MKTAAAPEVVNGDLDLIVAAAAAALYSRRCRPAYRLSCCCWPGLRCTLRPVRWLITQPASVSVFRPNSCLWITKKKGKKEKKGGRVRGIQEGMIRTAAGEAASSISGSTRRPEQCLCRDKRVAWDWRRGVINPHFYLLCV